MEPLDLTGLPEKLVADMLSRGEVLGQKLLEVLSRLKSSLKDMRQALEDRGLILHESSFGYQMIPCVCGIDGSCTVEKTVSFDVVACGALGVEGLAPPSGVVKWPDPHHELYLGENPMNPDADVLARGLMTEMELILAAGAPHDVVLLDGSLLSPLINVGKASACLWKSQRTREMTLGEAFLDKFNRFLNSYALMLTLSRSDRVFAGIPKQTARREIGEAVGWPEELSDRFILSFVLRPGELTSPLPSSGSRMRLHLKLPPGINSSSGKVAEEIIKACGSIAFVYYRPNPFVPPVRLEVPGPVAASESRMGLLLQAVRHQMTVPAIMEPYPLFMADQFAKRMAVAMTAVKQVAARTAISGDNLEAHEVFAIIHGHRTEDLKWTG